MIEVRRVKAEERELYLNALSEVLADCVDGNASVGFMSPLSKGAARDFFGGVFNEVEKGNRILIAAFQNSELVGTVQVILSMPPNQPHRADVAKLLVKRSARKQGVAEALMSFMEQSARSEGKTLLVLDTVVGESADRLYTRLGWTRAGTIPGYALFPDGRLCDTAIFWKDLTRMLILSDEGLD